MDKTRAPGRGVSQRDTFGKCQQYKERQQIQTIDIQRAMVLGGGIMEGGGYKEKSQKTKILILQRRQEGASGEMGGNQRREERIPRRRE